MNPWTGWRRGQEARRGAGQNRRKPGARKHREAKCAESGGPPNATTGGGETKHRNKDEQPQRMLLRGRGEQKKAKKAQAEWPINEPGTLIKQKNAINKPSDPNKKGRVARRRPQ